jgi:hypothetical protein
VSRFWFALPVFCALSLLGLAQQCPCDKSADAAKPSSTSKPPDSSKPRDKSETHSRDRNNKRHHSDENSHQPATANPTISVDINLGGSSDKNAEESKPAALSPCAAELTEGKAAERVWDLETATRKYSEAMRSCNGKDQEFAVSRFDHLRDLMGTWWYTAGSYVPPIRWLFVHPLQCLLALFLLVVALSPKILPQGGALFWSRRAVQSVFMPKFLGQAIIIAPNDLGQGTQVALFAIALQYNAQLARQLMSGDRDHFQVRSTNLLSMPSELASSTFKDLPEVKGVNLGGIALILLNVGRYFGWRVETHLAYFPAPKDSPGQWARMLAVATLRWAWFSDAPIRVECNVRDSQDVDDLAFAIAARILGRYFVSDQRRNPR